MAGTISTSAPGSATSFALHMHRSYSGLFTTNIIGDAMITTDDEFGTIHPFFQAIRGNVPQPEVAAWIDAFDMDYLKRTQLAFMICMNAEVVPEETLGDLAPFFETTIAQASEHQDYDFLDRLLLEVQTRLIVEDFEPARETDLPEGLQAFFTHVAHSLQSSLRNVGDFEQTLSARTIFSLERIFAPTN